MQEKLKDFYLKKIGRRGKIAIWLVDGLRIRRDLDPEFTNYGQHFKFFYIPEDEFWIDREAVPDERGYFIDHLLTEWKWMKRGEGYLQALDKADLIEKSEREKSREVKKIIERDLKERLEAIHQSLLGQTKGKIAIWLVDGRLVRSLFLPYFTEGGHHLKYAFIPEKEIWLDNDLVPEERSYVLLHEIYEHGLMKKQGLTYAQSHKKASRLEWQCRHFPQRLPACLAKFGWESNDIFKIE